MFGANERPLLGLKKGAEKTTKRELAETVHSTEPERGVRVEKSLTMGGHSRAGGRTSHTGRCPEVAQNLPKSRGAGSSREGCVSGGVEANQHCAHCFMRSHRILLLLNFK